MLATTRALLAARTSQQPLGHALQASHSVVTRAKDEDDDEAAEPGKPLRVERLLANLGYGKRRECQQMVQRGRAVRKDGSKLKVGDKVLPGQILLDDEELDPAFPMVLMLHKPVGYVVTAPDDERILDPKVYDLLPYRFSLRRPFLSAVGRLDKATSGLLLMTDDGQLVHRINSPKRGIWKVYEATLDAPLTGKDAEAAIRRFASGAMTLVGDEHPLLPAKLEMLGDVRARVSICEGRYHQVRRMFTAVGREVVALHRAAVGGLSLGDLPSSEWKYLSLPEVEEVFAGPSSEDIMGTSDSNSTGSSGTSGATSLERRAPSAVDEDEEEGQQVAGEAREPVAPMPKKVLEDEKRRRRTQALKKMVKNM